MGIRTGWVRVGIGIHGLTLSDQRWRRAASGERAVDSMGAADFKVEVEDSMEVGFTADDVTFGGGSTI